MAMARPRSQVFARENQCSCQYCRILVYDWALPGCIGSNNQSVNRTEIHTGAPMCAFGTGAIVACPGTKIAYLGPAILLETLVPRQLGNWIE